MSIKKSALERKLARNMATAMKEFNLVEDGDRVMIAISGGKDSYALLRLMDVHRRVSPVKYEIIAVHLDQVQPGYDGRPMIEWLEAKGYPHHIIREDTYSIVKDKVAEGKTYCSLCSRLRRGILYTTAVKLGCTKIALGHHRDDLLETFMLNLIFAGQLKTMPPKLLSDDGRNVVIRPLAYCEEKDLAAFAEEEGFPILPCNLCGSQTNLKRQVMKEMLAGWEEKWPDSRHVMLSALTNVRGSHLLDRKLMKRLGLPVADTLEPRAHNQEGDQPREPKVISELRVAEELGF